MFDIGSDGYLTAEYFAYDNAPAHMLFVQPLASEDLTLLMKDLGLRIPVCEIRQSLKANTDYFRISMPAVRVYECLIHGWVGCDAAEPVRSASLTLSGLPALNLPRFRRPIPETRTGRSGLSLRAEIEQAALELECPEWRITISQGTPNWVTEQPTVYLATISKPDGSVFTLGENEPETGIIDALLLFLSFQSNRWIRTPTIICNPPTMDNSLADRAWLGELESESEKPRNELTSSDWSKWPRQFSQFWRLYSDEEQRNHLQHAVQHYVDCAHIMRDGTLNYSLVASISTLQALTRWWNKLDDDFHFTSARDKRFVDLLLTAIESAKLGADDQKVVDIDHVSSLIGGAYDYRSKIDHGRGGTTGFQPQTIANYQMYCHNLARLLILAQLGDHGVHSRGFIVGPYFIDVPTLCKSRP